LIAFLEWFGIDWVQWLQGQPEAHSASIASYHQPAGLSMLADWFQSLWAKAAEWWSFLKTTLSPWGLALITAGITLVISFYYRIRHMRVLYTEAAGANWIKPTDPLAAPQMRFTAHECALLKKRFWRKGLTMETNAQGFRVRRWGKRFAKRGTPPKIPYAVQTMQKGGLIRLERVNKRFQPDLDNGKYLQARFTSQGERYLAATKPGIGPWGRVLRWAKGAWHHVSPLLRRRSGNSARSTANPR
jgi:hypothetical protein